MKNFLSIDFESWVYPDLPEFRNLSSQERKKLDAGFVKESAERILKVLAEYKTKLTFFILGELYEWYPEVISEIAREGHEVAYHSHRHEKLESKETLLKTLRQSEQFLHDFHPIGFRSPGIFIEKKYFTILAKNGFSYDSSIYGPYNLRREIGGITEIPISTYPLWDYPVTCQFPRPFLPKMLFKEPPVGSGLFLATLGKKVAWFLRQLNKRGQPFIAFIHNWQITKPRNASFPYPGYILTHPAYLPYLRDCYKIFEYLLSNFEFGRMESLLKAGQNE